MPLLTHPPHLPHPLRPQRSPLRSLRSPRSLLGLFFILLILPISAQPMSLEETLASFSGDVEFRWDPFFAAGTFVSGEYAASFAAGRAGEQGTVLFDYQELMILPLPYLDNGSIRFPGDFVSQVRNSFNRNFEHERNRFRVGAIVIDPGHGGVDPGAVWDDYVVNGRTITVLEKDITLRASLSLHTALREAFPDRQIILTRDGDTTISLDERVNIANSLILAENEIAIFISVHANSSLGNRNARGFEVWYLDPSHRRDVIDVSEHDGFEDVIPIINSMMEETISTDSVILANYILNRLDDAIGETSPNRGLKSQNWFVVRNALMPSVLIETGFISNREEAFLLMDDTYLMKLTNALYKGIVDFVNYVEYGGGTFFSQ